MGLRLHNTLTRTKQDFVPIDAANVRMYVCGPTVYDFAHIGNARPLIVFDVLFRLLRHLYGDKHVTYVRNITDVDDKINARAAEEYPDKPLNDAIRAVTEKTTAQFHADVDALGCLRPTQEPRATEYVERPTAPTDMIRMIAELIANGHAYAAEGHVLFHVASMPDYGKLSNRSLDDMIAGARVEVAPYKRDPMDFVLWKPSKRGEPSWPSPWSNGRPGWHIECSAMAGALLGNTFDIHGGGIDLIFPHHENEIAQSRCAHGTSVMANYWLHNGFLQVEGEKMSKSLGNFVTIRELRQGWGGYPWPGESLRFNMLRTQYTKPLDWTVDSLDVSHKTLWGWYEALDRVAPSEVPGVIYKTLEDDLNTPDMITELHGLHRKGDLPGLLASLLFLGFSGKTENILRIESKRVFAESGHYGMTGSATAMTLRGTFIPGDAHSSSHFTKEQIALFEARAAARARKDFAEADRLRAQLDAMGIALKDSKDPKTGELVTTWEVKR